MLYNKGYLFSRAKNVKKTDEHCPKCGRGKVVAYDMHH